MSELKTLKDLIMDVKVGVGTSNERTIGKNLSIEELKQEAIKWVKEDIIDYRCADLHLPAPPRGINIHNFIVRQRQKWKDRFNISKEDLK